MRRHTLLWTILFALAAPSAIQAETVPSSALILDADAQRDAGIVTDVAALRPFTETLSAPGEVKADAYATQLVSPRVASQVIARKATLGDLVKAGTPLVELSSVEVAETQGQLIVATQDWSRVSALGEQAVSARRYQEAQIARDQARAKLKAYGLSDDQIARIVRRGSAAADGRFALLAPGPGRIVSDDFIVGQRIEPGQVLFTLVTEDTLWVDARLPPAAADTVKEGSEVSVLAHGETLPATVIRRLHTTDETTRTASLRLRVDNRRDLLHPGELVEARIPTGNGTPQLAVPAEAIVLLQNQPTVFVRGRQADTFEPTPVDTGPTRDGWTAIRQGLAPGAVYVRQGAFALKARILRSQLGDD